MRGKNQARLAAVLLMGALASGCRTGDARSSFARRAARSIPLVVENHNFLDITVYAVGNGASVRLGEVTGKSSERFTMDPRQIAFTTGLQLEVDPIGSARQYLSPVVYPDQAATVLLTVAAQLDRSYVTMR